MYEAVVSIAQALSTGNNQIAVICFVMLIMIGGVLMAVLRMLNSVIDLKRELYKAEILPDRGKKGSRY